MAEWRLEPVAEISPAGEPSFMRVVSLAVDGHGNVFVADRGAFRVWVFDSLGAPLRGFGRQGSGPGEFRDIYSLAWAGDTLAVLDPGNGRIELVARDGAWIDSRDGARITGAGVRLHQSGPGGFYLPGFRRTAQGIQRLLLSSDGARDTLALPPPEAVRSYGVVCETAGGGISHFGSPWDPEVITAVSPAGELVLTQSAGNRLEFFEGAATLQRVLRFESALVSISDPEWDSVVAEYRGWRERMNARHCEPDELPRPGARQTHRAIEFDDEGRLWLETTVVDGFMFQVYDSALTLQANVRAPERDPGIPFVVRGGRLYVVTTDGSGDQAVRGYRLTVPAH